MKAGKRDTTVFRRIGTAVAALAATTGMVAATGTPAAAYTPRFSFAGINDWDDDGHQDLIARDTGGRLWLFPGESTRAASGERRVLIGQRFAGYSLSGPVDWDADGHVDLLVRTTSGQLMLHIGESVRGISDEGWARLGQGFAGFSVAGMGDWDGDGHVDVVARDSRGRVWLYPGDSSRGPTTDGRFLIGDSMQDFTFAGVADWDGDEHVDLIARDARGRMWLYPGESSRGYSGERRVLIGFGFTGFALPDVADWDDDGHVDLVARDNTGRLWLYPGESVRGYSTERRALLGRGW